MTIRKRRNYSGAFNIPPGFNPGSGSFATVQTPGLAPYCAMMQIAEEDKYDDYVICRGFDPRIRAFVDYSAGDPDELGISVAKPFGKRIKCYYQVGHIYPAMLPIQGTEGNTPSSPTSVPWRVGQNPGTSASGCLGHPQAMPVVVSELVDHNSVNVNWLLLDGGPATLWVVLT